MPTYQCFRCSAVLKSSREQLSHMTEQHDSGYVPRGQRAARRPVSCWRCAQDIYRDEADGEYRCSCGFVIPPKAQFVVDDEDITQDT